mgnify:CR=1 FL=1
MTHPFAKRLCCANNTSLLLAVCGLFALCACGCRSLAPGGAHVHPRARQMPPPDMYATPADGCPVNPVEEMASAMYPDGIPLPQIPVMPWAPPGMELPWPHDEYLHDGGDRNVQVTVTANDTVNGLELEDTVHAQAVGAGADQVRRGLAGVQFDEHAFRQPAPRAFVLRCIFFIEHPLALCPSFGH